MMATPDTPFFSCFFLLKKNIYKKINTFFVVEKKQTKKPKTFTKKNKQFFLFF